MMDDLIQAIDDHSHFDGAEWADDNFWENLYEEYGEQYRKESAQTKTKADFSSFQVWADEHNLVPDMDYEND